MDRLEERAEEIVQDYLDCELLLRKFFDLVDYCFPNCISQESNGGSKTGVGCCRGYNHGDRIPMGAGNLQVTITEIFLKRRGQKYGDPEDKLNEEGEIEICRYHSKEEGCHLIEYKSPICIGHACRELRDHLRRNYGIEYQAVVEKFEKILDGELTMDEVDNFKESIKSWTKIIKTTP